LGGERSRRGGYSPDTVPSAVPASLGRVVGGGRKVKHSAVLALSQTDSEADWPLHDIVLTNIVWCMAYKGRSKRGRILPNSRATVLQQCRQCRRAGRMKGRLTRAPTVRSKTISCKGQVVLRVVVCGVVLVVCSVCMTYFFFHRQIPTRCLA